MTTSNERGFETTIAGLRGVAGRNLGHGECRELTPGARQRFRRRDRRSSVHPCRRGEGEGDTVRRSRRPRLSRGGQLVEVADALGGVQVKVTLTMEIEGSAKPACDAECLIRLLGGG